MVDFACCILLACLASAVSKAIILVRQYLWASNIAVKLITVSLDAALNEENKENVLFQLVGGAVKTVTAT